MPIFINLGDTICDFCSEPGAIRYPADSFDCLMDAGGFGQISHGDWAACSVCHAMIQADDRAGLAVRSLNLLLRANPELSPHANDIYTDLVALHAKFFEHRTGEPTPQ